jgi:hypothetical protein
VTEVSGEKPDGPNRVPGKEAVIICRALLGGARQVSVISHLR